jgi:hypothetical protein
MIPDDGADSGVLGVVIRDCGVTITDPEGHDSALRRRERR